MFKYYSSHFFLYFSLSHLFCCGLPILMSSNLFFSNFFLASSILNFEFLEIAENFLFSVSTILLLSMIFIHFNTKKTHQTKSSHQLKYIQQHKKIKLNIFISLPLYVFNTSIYVLEKI